MISRVAQSPSSGHMAAAAQSLRTPSLPWLAVLAVDVVVGAGAASLANWEIVKIPNVPSHTAAVLGFAAAELLAAFINLILVLRWWREVQVIEHGWGEMAYRSFREYLAESGSPLDNRNVESAADAVCKVVTTQGWVSHVWHASAGMIVCVPACLSVLHVATQQGAPRERWAEFIAPLIAVVLLATFTLIVSLLGYQVRCAGLASWKTEACDRRATDIGRRIAEAAPDVGSMEHIETDLHAEPLARAAPSPSSSQTPAMDKRGNLVLREPRLPKTNLAGADPQATNFDNRDSAEHAPYADDDRELEPLEVDEPQSQPEPPPKSKARGRDPGMWT